MEFIKGFTFAPFARKGSYSRKEAYRSLDNLKERVGINFIILAPNGLQDTPQSEEICYTSNSTVSDKELEEVIAYAKKMGVRVALKPTVNCKNGTWRAHINFFDEEVHCEPKWSKWFDSYTNFQLHYAEIAEKAGCEMFIAVVPQNAILFSETIRENILYGTKDISNEELNKIIKAANLEELIESLPNGLDTKITEHGRNLSGGQRQRISIARAFVRNPKILVLDEATSALDSVSEKKIQESIGNLVKDRTTLVVAHRLSTIRNADKIAVIGNGGLEEFGTYDGLMEKKG